MTENEFQGWIIDVARRFGWRVWHVPAPMRWDPKAKKWVPAKSGSGLCDLLLLHEDPARLILAEVKAQAAKLTADQAEFLRLAREVRRAFESALWFLPGMDVSYVTRETPLGVYVWRPGLEDAIEETLRSKVMAA